MSAADLAVVLLAHGSPDPRHARGVERLAVRVRDIAATRGTNERVLCAFLDHNTPTPEDAAASLLDNGVREAIVVPLLLTTGFHSHVDVPLAMALIAERAHECAVTLSRPLAIDPGFAKAIEELLRNSGVAATSSTGVLLIGAGSRDPEALATLAIAAQEIAASSEFHVAAAFVDAEPSVFESHAALVARGCDLPIQALSVVISDGILRGRLATAADEVGAHLVPGTLVDTDALAAFALDGDARSARRSAVRLGVAGIRLEPHASVDTSGSVAGLRHDDPLVAATLGRPSRSDPEQV